MVNYYGGQYYSPVAQYDPWSMQQLLVPGVHVNLSKTTDGFINHTWACNNASTTTAGSANLRVLEGATLVFGPSVDVSIGPGLTVNLVLFNFLMAGKTTGTHTYTLVMTDVTPGFPVKVIGSHNYTVTISAAAPILTAVGDPTIV